MNRLAVPAAVCAVAYLVAACTATSDPAASRTAGPKLACPQGRVIAEGSTAQRNALLEAIAAYGAHCKNQAIIQYNASSSGAGISAFTNALVDFAGSDSALSDQPAGSSEQDRARARCQGNDAWNLPMVLGPIAITYNVPGADGLVLTPVVLAKIFSEQITTWNDPAIRASNPGANLPAAKIAVFNRSGRSGTTENLTRYLNAAAPQVWGTDKIDKSWKGRGEARESSDAIAKSVGQTPNSLSYVEYSYARDSKLQLAQIDNGAGPVALTPESASRNMAEAKTLGSGHDLRLQLNYLNTGAGSYPINLVSYEIVCPKGLPPAKAAVIKDFFTFLVSDQQQQSLSEDGYAPLPPSLRTQVRNAVEGLA